MVVIVISLIAAAIQMGLLLLTARVVGVDEYARFSLIIAVAAFLSAVLSEWLRMIVAYHAGSRRVRLRNAVLRQVRSWIIALSASATLLGLMAAAIAWSINYPDAAWFVAATGIAAAGMMLSDMSAAFLRFGAQTRWHYNAYTMVRVTMMGGAALVMAVIGASGPAVAATFGVAGMAIGGIYVATAWPGIGPARPRLLVRLAGQGWSLATGSIGTNLALTLARTTLGVALPGRLAGGALLSIDLFARGGNVLGSSLCTWGFRVLMDGLHHDGKIGAQRSFRIFSGVFLSIWYSIALIGLMACLVIPVYTLHLTQIGLHFAVTLPTLIAIALLFNRVLLFDSLLAALSLHREVALTASLTAVLAGIDSAIAPLVHNAVVAACLFPLTTLALSVFYLARNGAEIRPAVDMPAVRFGIIKMALFGAAVAAYETRPILLLIGAMMILVDLRRMVALFAAYRHRVPGLRPTHMSASAV